MRSRSPRWPWDACYHRRVPPPRRAAMPLDIVVVMDPIGSIRIAKDSTFAMLLEAQRRGHRLWCGGRGARAGDAGRGVATVAPLSVADDPAPWFDLGAPARLELGPGHVVLMRKDPPVASEFIHDTQVLSLAARAGALVVNDPQGL